MLFSVVILCFIELYGWKFNPRSSTAHGLYAVTHVPRAHYQGETPATPLRARKRYVWLACRPTVARPAVQYGPVQLALTPAHLPELTHSLPHHLSRRVKCAAVSWQCSPKCQPGVTNPCRPLGPRRPGSVGRCPASDGGARNMPR